MLVLEPQTYPSQSWRRNTNYPSQPDNHISAPIFMSLTFYNFIFKILHINDIMQY